MKYVVIGGTGTLGQATITELMRREPGTSILCVSRDELKQKEMRAALQNPAQVSFCLGDIRDRSSFERYLEGADVVFHFAALKHIDVLEEFPEESLKTNVLGTINVADACIAQKVPFCVFSSTDKAVEPINAYGMSKGLSEKILFRRNETQKTTCFSVYRWGNVLGSRGSVIPMFAEKLRAGEPVPLTSSDMTRFWIPIEKAVEFILSTYDGAKKCHAMIPPIKGASVVDVIHSVARVVGVESVVAKPVGLRRGEKIHESLRGASEGGVLNSGACENYTADELDELVRGVLCRSA